MYPTQPTFYFSSLFFSSTHFFPIPIKYLFFPPPTNVSILQLRFFTQNTRRRRRRRRKRRKRSQKLATSSNLNSKVGLIFVLLKIFFGLKISVKLGFQNKNKGNLGIICRTSNGNNASLECVFVFHLIWYIIKMCFWVDCNFKRMIWKSYQTPKNEKIPI